MHNGVVNIKTTFHDIKTTGRGMTAGKEEARELTTHAGLDEHRQSVVLGCTTQWDKYGSLNHGTM